MTITNGNRARATKKPGSRIEEGGALARAVLCVSPMHSARYIGTTY